MARTVTPDPRAYLPLTPFAFQVLLAIADRPRHGYGIIREIDTCTAGRIRLRTGTLYTLLRRLEAEAFIEEAAPRPAPEDDDPRRRYYGLTPLGRAVMQAEARRLEQAVGEARRKKALGRP